MMPTDAAPIVATQFARRSALGGRGPRWRNKHTCMASYLEEADDAVVVGRNEGSGKDTPISRHLPQAQASPALALVTETPLALIVHRQQ